MSSSLHYVTLDEINAIMPEIIDNGFAGSIDYAKINSEDEYLNAIGKIFRFPLFDGQTGHSWNSYFDWMTDLSWENDDEWMRITKKGYNLIIYNCDINGYADRYDDLLKKIIDSFVYDILPWWDKDVVNCVVDGEPKSFNVYLVI